MRWPCCGLITTAENLARWGYELYSSNGAAVADSVRTQLFAALLTDPVFYQGIMQHDGYFTTQRTYVLPSSANLTTVGHPGAGGGYSTLLRYSPELDVVVVLLANSLLQERGTCGSLEGQRDVRHCLASRIFAAYAG